ncbi:MAG: AMP-binding protein [Cryobacterium sp.]|uniref:AMP-binding protein n=1 Tax=unclassified Cryobacterium TaxID=2649013 RepID=UPI0018C978FD|nr:MULTISPECIES: AMP-binding protein [unclassified Cryobacterium]MCY7403937.1 AMP-binding protein [Cryobacterium sp.]MEC5155330.1 fatty-acyl-CoA synthase [Cryobacterium sp. CAN_C3]
MATVLQTSQPSTTTARSSLSYSQGVSTVPLLGETIGQNLRRIAARWPETDAVVDVPSATRLTYHEFDRAVDDLARALIAGGLHRGDRVGIWSPNTLEWVVLQYATARAGVILVNINPAYRSHELRYALEQSGCRWLFTVEEFKGSDYREMIRAVGGQLPALTRLVFIGTSDWPELVEQGRGHDLAAREAQLTFDDPINIQYTSGTTGFPKGATLTHHNILNNGFFVGEGTRYTAQDRVCIPVPFYHCFGMVLGNLACTTHGATIVIPAASFDAEATLRAVELEKCTSLYGVPSMFISELALPNLASFDLSTLRTGIMAGSPCPVDVMRRCIDEMNMNEVTICYGMTETAPVSAQTAVDDPLAKRVGSVGRIHPHIEVKVINPETALLVPRGEPGELCTRGYSVMLGYWNEPTKTADAIDAAGWMHTGDLATLDDEGYLNIVGRIKDVIIRGGENVYPSEIEEFLYTHPDILDVQVIGVPDAHYGEEVMAWVILREGASLETEELRAFCHDQIAHYKIPRYVHVTDAFQMTITGKVQKYLMREQSVLLLGLPAASATA